MSGFTLIEVLVAIGISAILFSTGAFATVSFYRSTVFNQEADLFLELLEKTRNEAINNINDKPHTFLIDSGSYLIDAEKYERNKSLIISGPKSVVFQNISGEVSTPAA